MLLGLAYQHILKTGSSIPFLERHRLLQHILINEVLMILCRQKFSLDGKVVLRSFLVVASRTPKCILALPLLKILEYVPDVDKHAKDAKPTLPTSFKWNELKKKFREKQYQR